MSTETNYKENLLNGEKPSPVITQAKDSNMQPNLSTSYGRKSSEVLYNCDSATICSSRLYLDSNLRISNTRFFVVISEKLKTKWCVKGSI